MYISTDDIDGVVDRARQAHWSAFFAVADCDATVARPRELGGAVLLEPLDAPGVGRFSMVDAPQGAQLGVIAVATPVT